MLLRTPSRSPPRTRTRREIQRARCRSRRRRNLRGRRHLRRRRFRDEAARRHRGGRSGHGDERDPHRNACRRGSASTGAARSRTHDRSRAGTEPRAPRVRVECPLPRGDRSPTRAPPAPEHPEVLQHRLRRQRPRSPRPPPRRKGPRRASISGSDGPISRGAVGRHCPLGRLPNSFSSSLDCPSLGGASDLSSEGDGLCR
jgi:hypothetical protein